MTTQDQFWQVIHDQLEELRTAESADDVLRILATEKNPYATVLGTWASPTTDSPAFFAGNNRDSSVMITLRSAGWLIRGNLREYIARSPDGMSAISYTEGHIDRATVMTTVELTAAEAQRIAFVLRDYAQEDAADAAALHESCKDLNRLADLIEGIA